MNVEYNKPEIFIAALSSINFVCWVCKGKGFTIPCRQESQLACLVFRVLSMGRTNTLSKTGTWKINEKESMVVTGIGSSHEYWLVEHTCIWDTIKKRLRWINRKIVALTVVFGVKHQSDRMIYANVNIGAILKRRAAQQHTRRKRWTSLNQVVNKQWKLFSSTLQKQMPFHNALLRNTRFLTKICLTSVQIKFSNHCIFLMNCTLALVVLNRMANIVKNRI